jgi:hypothetical protein
LLTRVSTRSAVSRSVSRVATAARSVSRRASRSLIFVFSALIWSNIVGVEVGMVAFSGFRLIGMINLLASNSSTRDIQPQNALTDLVGGRRESARNLVWPGQARSVGWASVGNSGVAGNARLPSNLEDQA